MALDNDYITHDWCNSELRVSDDVHAIERDATHTNTRSAMTYALWTLLVQNEQARERSKRTQ